MRNFASRVFLQTGTLRVPLHRGFASKTLSHGLGNFGAKPEEEQAQNENVVNNMGKLNIESMDKQLSPSAVDISAYLGDKKWNRQEGSKIEKPRLLELFLDAEKLSIDELVEKYTTLQVDDACLEREDIESLVKMYGVPTIEKNTDVNMRAASAPR